MCDNYGLKGKRSTEYNLQSNGIVERVHQVLGNTLRTFELEKEKLKEVNPWEPFLSAAAFVIRSTYHTTLEATLGQLVFGRDMVLQIKFKADWACLRLNKSKRIEESNICDNKK